MPTTARWPTAWSCCATAGRARGGPMRLVTYTLRELLRRPGRTLLTLLGIAVGVAAGVATSTAVSAAHRAYRELSEGVGGEPYLEVAAPGHSGFDPALLAGLRSAPGVRAVVPCVQTT